MHYVHGIKQFRENELSIQKSVLKRLRVEHCSALGSFCSDGEALSLYFKTPKFYPSTAERRSSISLLQDAEVLPLYCGKAKLYLSTARRRSSTPLLWDGEALPLLAANSRSSTPPLRDSEALPPYSRTVTLLH